MAAERIEIGDACMIAHGAYLSDADWHGIYDRAEPVGKTKPIVLKDNVWIGNNAIISSFKKSLFYIIMTVIIFSFNSNKQITFFN